MNLPLDQSDDQEDKLLPLIREYIQKHGPEDTNLDELIRDVMQTALLNKSQLVGSGEEPQGHPGRPCKPLLEGIARFESLAHLSGPSTQEEHPLLNYLIELARLAIEAGRLPNPRRMNAENCVQAIRQALTDCPDRVLMVAGPYFKGKMPEQIARELGISDEETHASIGRLVKGINNALRPRPLPKSSPHIVFSPSVTVYQAVNQCNQQQVRNRQFGGNNSLIEYQRAVDQLDQLDEDTRARLKQARAEINEGREDLSPEDQEYLVQELDELTEELVQDQPRQSFIQRAFNHIKEVSRTIASILSSATALAKILKS